MVNIEEIFDTSQLEIKENPKGECLYRWIGQCPNCERDFENHYPNNLDCPRYKPIGEFYVLPIQKLSRL